VKRNGYISFCVDYGKLNYNTKKGCLSLSDIEDILDMTKGAKSFSSLDLTSGYRQVALLSDDKEKTAFSTDQGLWQFRVMPFGLCNAPATFDRLIEIVLGGIRVVRSVSGRRDSDWPHIPGISLQPTEIAPDNSERPI
jgi:hypothetical protein